MKKRISLLLCLIALLNLSHIAFADSPAVADASQMTTVEEVVEPGMSPVYAEDLADGEYGIAFKCSSSMFRIDSALLKVHEGKMEAVLTMGSKSFLYVWPGSAEEAAAASVSDWIAPVEAEDGRRGMTARCFSAPIPCPQRRSARASSSPPGALA